MYADSVYIARSSWIMWRKIGRTPVVEHVSMEIIESSLEFGNFWKTAAIAMSFLSAFSKALPGFAEQLVSYIFAIACAIGKKTGRWIGAEYRGVEAHRYPAQNALILTILGQGLHLLQSAHGRIVNSVDLTAAQ